MKLSIVSTLYRSAPYIEEFVTRLESAASGRVDEFELILVDDGSPDNSLELALEQQRRFPFIKVLELSRNFGHHSAIAAGLDYADGDLVFLIDSDLEEQPEWLSLFVEAMRETGADVVYGVQDQRVAAPIANFCGGAFWKAINFMSHVRIPHNPMTCRLMSRDYVHALRSVDDRVLYLAGVFAWAGFKQHQIKLTKTARPAGHKSTYGLARRFGQVVDSFSSFNVAPLYFVFISGLLSWSASLLFGIYLLVVKIAFPDSVQGGFTSLMLSIWFFSGLIILSIGIVGLYLAKVFQEVKRRPLYLTRKLHEGLRDV